MSKKDTVAVLLCAGKGTRMNDNRTHKVCYEVGGVPVIIRQLENLKKAGIDKYMIVTGDRAEEVMKCTCTFEGVAYAYQKEQNGTGDAAMCGLKALEAMGFDGDAMIIMGDKIIASDVISDLIEKREKHSDSVVLMVQNKEDNFSAGRIVTDKDGICGVVEMADSFLTLLGESEEKSETAYRRLLEGKNINDKKKNKIIQSAINAENISEKYTLGEKSFSHAEIESFPYVNAGTYVLGVKEAISLLSRVNSDNAQGEVYLTDIIALSAPVDEGNMYVLEGKEKVLTYSTIDELRGLEKYFI